jgi:hypothetical protein
MAVARTARGIVVSASLAVIGSFLAICFMKKAMPVLCTQAQEARGWPLGLGGCWGAAGGKTHPVGSPAGRFLGGWSGGLLGAVA